MTTCNFIDKLQDVICICDCKGAILDSNDQFKKRIFSSKSNATHLNFVHDLLYEDHKELFSVAVKLMELNPSLPSEEQNLCVSLGIVKTLSVTSKNSCKTLAYLLTVIRYDLDFCC
jgi:hypothetical protein